MDALRPRTVIDSTSGGLFACVPDAPDGVTRLVHDQKRTVGPLGEADGVPADDVLDAAVSAWSAHRIALGTAERIPAEPHFDAEGRRVEIRY